jgi:hypothetical protein
VFAPPTDCGEIVQAHDDGAFSKRRIDELPVIDLHRL